MSRVDPRWQMTALKVYSTPSVREMGDEETGDDGVLGERHAVTGEGGTLFVEEVTTGGVAGGESSEQIRGSAFVLSMESTRLGAFLNGEEPPRVGMRGRLLEMIAGSMQVCSKAQAG